MSGHLLPTPPALNTLLSSISIPLTLIFHSMTIVITVFPPLNNPSMYFVRSGNINLTYGSLRAAGFDGNFWSSVADPINSQAAFRLGFNSTSAYPSANNTRYYGFSLRKLVSMPHPCISSVVAISTSLPAHFGAQVLKASSGELTPILPTLNSSSTSTSILLVSALPIPIIATKANPSALYYYNVQRYKEI